ncbi:MAG: hypothetical protein IGS48_02210 [Oscillatoriales cyanobacterium C42_A2020_001]|nr:hypothetical protein [Leptolyngbyaceae cyanobacterium C42_A2020_001]
MPGLWRVHWQLNNIVLFSSFYTRHDQACLLWSGIVAVIFLTAQFLPLSWATQTLVATTLSLLGVMGMVGLTWRFVRIERLSWVLGCWAGLMLAGALSTYLGTFAGWTWALVNMCPLWLGLSATGYCVTSIGMRSRLFLLLGVLHWLTIGILPYFPLWKPLITGLVISGSAFLIAEFQWDANGVCGYQMAALDRLEQEPANA